VAAGGAPLVVGDVLSDYIGWVNVALGGPDVAATALTSLHRLADLGPRVLLPGHGPIPADPGTAVRHRTPSRPAVIDDPDGAVRYAARRIFAFALMIRDGIPVSEAEPYLHARPWLTDAAQLLDSTPEPLDVELIDTMLGSGAIILRDKRLHAAADHTPVAAESLRLPFPAAWPTAAPTTTEAAQPS
jgi:hypothetical protein